MLPFDDSNHHRDEHELTGAFFGAGEMELLKAKITNVKHLFFHKFTKSLAQNKQQPKQNNKHTNEMKIDRETEIKSEFEHCFFHSLAVRCIKQGEKQRQKK